MRKTTKKVEKSSLGQDLLGPVDNTQLKCGTSTGETHGTHQSTVPCQIQPSIQCTQARDA